MDRAKGNDKILKPDTLDFILEYTKDAPERQLQDAEAMDSKMMHVLAFASVVLGLAGISGGNAQSSGITVGILGIALAAYVIVAASAFYHLRIIRFRRSLQADVLWSQYWQDDVQDIKHSLVDDIWKAYEHNKAIMRNKSKTISLALIAASVQVVSIGVFVMVSEA